MKQNLLIISLLIIATLAINAQWNGTNPLWTNSNVGLGITSPVRSLHIRKNVPNGIGASLMLENAQYSANDGAESEIVFNHLQTNSGEPFRYSKIHSVGSGQYGQPGRLSIGLVNDNDIYKDYLTILRNGNIGIGTTNPTKSLVIRKDVFGGMGASIYLSNNEYGNSGSGTEILFGHYSDTDNPRRYARIYTVSNANGQPARMSFGEGSDGTFTDYLSIIQGGNLGIGTTSPSQKLHIRDGYALFNNNPGFDDPYSGLRICSNTSPSKYNWLLGAQHNVNNGFEITPSTTTGGTTFNAPAFVVKNDGKIGIGTSNPQNLLDVNGTIHAKEFKASLDGWSDYVFSSDYKLMSLSEVESYIKSNNKLPEIPSAKEVKKDGVNLGEMNALLLKKVEELTLYIIEQNKVNQLQNREIEILKQMIRTSKK